MLQAIDNDDSLNPHPDEAPDNQPLPEPTPEEIDPIGPDTPAPNPESSPEDQNIDRGNEIDTELVDAQVMPEIG